MNEVIMKNTEINYVVRDSIRELKKDLKLLSVKIREFKRIRDTSKNIDEVASCMSELVNIRESYRLCHILYCLIRGRKYLEVENKVAYGNKGSLSALKCKCLQYNGLDLDSCTVKQLEGLR